MTQVPISLTRNLIPAFAVKDAAKAISFYEKAFDAKELYRLIDPENGKVGHAEVMINGGKIMLSDEYPGCSKTPETLGGTTVKLTLTVDDVDKSVERAADAGATIVRPPSNEFWGYRSATISDPFRHVWVLEKNIENLTPAEMRSRWEALVTKDGEKKCE